MGALGAATRLTAIKKQGSWSWSHQMAGDRLGRHARTAQEPAIISRQLANNNNGQVNAVRISFVKRLKVTRRYLVDAAVSAPWKTTFLFFLSCLRPPVHLSYPHLPSCATSATDHIVLSPIAGDKQYELVKQGVG
ncbi:hypothetical protein ACSS6W_007652 [Trichoderma asperelloides]